MYLWEENSPNNDGKQNMAHSYVEAVQEFKKREVSSIAIIESLFMAVYNIFLFAWTPILQSSTTATEINIGIIFITFIMSMIAGTMLFEVSFTH